MPLHDGLKLLRTTVVSMGPETRCRNGPALHASCSLSLVGDAGEELSGHPGPGKWRPRGGSRVRD